MTRQRNLPRTNGRRYLPVLPPKALMANLSRLAFTLNRPLRLHPIFHSMLIVS
ncbi:hypothetical protein FOXYSP1_18893 [Fusarium oxysporum f. sp. phaseoli]